MLLWQTITSTDQSRKSRWRARAFLREALLWLPWKRDKQSRPPPPQQRCRFDSTPLLVYVVSLNCPALQIRFKWICSSGRSSSLDSWRRRWRDNGNSQRAKQRVGGSLGGDEAIVLNRKRLCTTGAPGNAWLCSTVTWARTRRKIWSAPWRKTYSGQVFFWATRTFQKSPPLTPGESASEQQTHSFS